MTQDRRNLLQTLQGPRRREIAEVEEFLKLRGVHREGVGVGDVGPVGRERGGIGEESGAERQRKCCGTDNRHGCQRRHIRRAQFLLGDEARSRRKIGCRIMQTQTQHGGHCRRTPRDIHAQKPEIDARIQTGVDRDVRLKNRSCPRINDEEAAGFIDAKCDVCRGGERRIDRTRDIECHLRTDAQIDRHATIDRIGLVQREADVIRRSKRSHIAHADAGQIL